MHARCTSATSLCSEPVGRCSAGDGRRGSVVISCARSGPHYCGQQVRDAWCWVRGRGPQHHGGGSSSIANMGRRSTVGSGGPFHCGRGRRLDEQQRRASEQAGCRAHRNCLSLANQPHPTQRPHAAPTHSKPNQHPRPRYCSCYCPRPLRWPPSGPSGLALALAPALSVARALCSNSPPAPHTLTAASLPRASQALRCVAISPAYQCPSPQSMAPISVATPQRIVWGLWHWTGSGE
jgi:hypothetical protein